MVNFPKSNDNFKPLVIFSADQWLKIFFLLILLSGLASFFVEKKKVELKKASQHIMTSIYGSPPLKMQGGDPYLRALMRTISASEANYHQPYHIIYGGQYVESLNSHPNQCRTIVNGPNAGKCTTASGRYQFLNTTWAEKAQKYHPQPKNFLLWQEFSFEPEYQDIVVYNWLNDSQAWGEDLKKLLQNGDIDEVLRLLSPTWTSLGYGIENNVMTQYLPSIYHKMLKEELKASQS